MHNVRNALSSVYAYMTTVFYINVKQLTMSARYKTGFGLTDGEVLERLWSYLRRFSKMTKEMRPSHRVDVLTDSLLYYSKLASDNLSESYLTVCIVCYSLNYFHVPENLLPKRYKRALCVAADSQSELQKLLTSSPGQKLFTICF